MADFPQPPASRTPVFTSDQNQNMYFTREWYLWFQQVALKLTNLDSRVKALEP